MTTPRAHVAIVVHSLRSGSVGSVALRHARSLARNFDVTVIARDAGDVAGPAVREIAVRHRNWAWLRRFGHLPNELAFLAASSRALATLHAQQPVDVVWCHSHAATVRVGAAHRTHTAARVVMTTHGDIFGRPAGTYPLALTWLYRWATPRAYRAADRVHVLSPAMGDIAVRSGSAQRNVRLIPNGIDAPELGLPQPPSRTVASFMPEGTLRLLYVGSLWTVKGAHILLQALATMRATGGPPARLTLAGDGPERAALMALAGSLGLSSSVEFLGAIPRAALGARFESSDLVCVPSLSETLPFAALEGMVAGLPIAGSDTGGIAWLVKPGVTGALAAPGDAAALARCITQVAATQESLWRMGSQGQAKALAEFAWPAIEAQLDALVRELMDGAT